VVLRHPPVLAFFLAGAVAASASYLMQKYFVFREHRRGPD
jgi:putative flippase GtrA